MGIRWEEKRIQYPRLHVTKAHPLIDWPKHWAWKDDCISDDAVHPVAREAVYRSIQTSFQGYGAQFRRKGIDGQNRARSLHRTLDFARWLHGSR